MKKIKGLFKKKWVKIVSIILLVVIVGISALFIVNRNKKNNLVSDFSYVRTVTLGYNSLEETIVASGTIESQNTSTITSSVNNATISKINYSVGDYVKEGDVIIELDTTNLSKQITKASESISEQEERLLDAYDTAEDNYDDIEDEYNTAKANKNTAYAAYETALNACASYQTKYNDANTALNTYVQTELGKGRDINAIKAETGTGTYEEYNNALTTAKNNLDAIKASTNYDALEKAYNEAYSKYSTLKSSLSKAEDSLDEAYEKFSEGVDTETLDDLYDTAADYKLKAKSAGQITNINAVLGSNTNGTLATIQDTSKLKISLTIDEYDIFKIELGMKCIIETDASDKQYEGVVSVISPVATNTMGSSGFEIEVNVTSTDVSQLLIGMNAEVTIIVSSTDENFSVPIDAVETKENGKQVIYVEDESGEFYEVEVTTGENNGYYIEIFGDELTQGMKVRASADASEAEVTITEDEISEEGFNLFGSFGGGGSMPSNMPSGGGNMPSGGGNMPSGGGDFSGGPNGR